MARLVFAHLMYGVVDCVKVLLLCKLGDAELILARTLLSEHSLLYVGLCVPYNLSEKFCELCSMLSTITIPSK